MNYMMPHADGWMSGWGWMGGGGTWVWTLVSVLVVGLMIVMIAKLSEK